MFSMFSCLINNAIQVRRFDKATRSVQQEKDLDDPRGYPAHRRHFRANKKPDPRWEVDEKEAMVMGRGKNKVQIFDEGC
jgi:hypothetical protein